MANAAAARTLLILDLDETLVHAATTPLDRPADFTIFGYHIYRRPHLDAFLRAVAAQFDLAIWSSASDDYVDGIVRTIMPSDLALEFVWGRSRATYTYKRRRYDLDYVSYDPAHYAYVKPLQKVRRKFGRPLERMLIVDDTPEKCARNFGNAIYIREFVGDLADEELLILARYLERLAGVSNVRRIEKRMWRSEILDAP